MATATHPATPRGADEKQRGGRECPTACAANVSEGERWASTIGGALLALYGISGRGAINNLLLPALGGMLVYRGLSGHCSVYSALGVNTAQKHGERTSIEAGRGEKVETSVFVNRPARDLYNFWRNLSQLPQIMSNLEEVRELDARRSHWKAKLPLGASVEWDAEIINDRPGELIAWRSLPGSEIDTAGSVHLAGNGAGRGTVVWVVLKFDPPGGKIGATIASWVGADPEQQIQEDLQRFKRLMESGTPQVQPPARQMAGTASF
jgi:uncharacterized membrane protein